jgi:hypothetical protein
MKEKKERCNEVCPVKTPDVKIEKGRWICFHLISHPALYELYELNYFSILQRVHVLRKKSHPLSSRFRFSSTLLSILHGFRPWTEKERG